MYEHHHGIRLEGLKKLREKYDNGSKGRDSNPEHIKHLKHTKHEAVVPNTWWRRLVKICLEKKNSTNNVQAAEQARTISFKIICCSRISIKETSTINMVKSNYCCLPRRGVKS
jgi:hypothetical protein